MDMEELDIEIGLALSKRVADKDTIQAGELPEGKTATCVQVGPCDEIRPAYRALPTWMEANGHVPAGVAYEFYLNDPSETPPEELMTQGAFPLRTS
jgi:effector-binding domain-containing protein